MTGWRMGGRLVAAIVAALGAIGAPAVGSGGTLNVVATTGMIADIARVVGGDRAQVTGLMGPGVDPHLYKATPGDMRLLSDADLILYNGLHLEGKMVDVLVRLARKKPTVQVTETIDETLLREPPEFQGNYDPHVWFDVSLWMKAVERTRDAMIEEDGAGRDGYSSRAEAYLKELADLHDWCRAELARIPPERRVLITAHDAFGYFGRAYGVEVLGIQGVSTDSEPDLDKINGLVDTIVARRLPAVFVESSVPPKTVQALVEGCRARGHSVRIGGELFSDAMGPGGTPEGTYIGMVRHNVRTIVGGLLQTEGAGDRPVARDGSR